MRNYLFCFFIIIQCPVFGQGWVRQFGSNDQREVFQTVFPATDSTVWCVGDSLDSKYIRFKEIDFKGNVLRDSSFNSINSSPNYGMSAIRKKDFGLVHVSYYSVNINWSAYSSLSYYQVISNDFVSFNGGVQNGGTGNDYRYFDFELPSNNTVLLVGTHINPDEQKLYIHRVSNPTDSSDWVKEIHDTTKHISGLRIYKADNDQFIVFAMRNGTISGNYIGQIGFLRINSTGDLLEANWIPNSLTGGFNNNFNALPIVQTSDGFYYYYRRNLYFINKMGQAVWQKNLDVDESKVQIRAIRRINDKILIVGTSVYSANEKSNYYASQLDLNGNVEWVQLLNLRETNYEEFNDIIGIDGGYIAVGASSSPSSYQKDFVAIKLNQDGTGFNNLLHGIVFYDQNANCLRDSGELGIVGQTVSCNKSYFPLSVPANDQGEFTIPSDTGTYIIKVSPITKAYWQPCVDSISGNFAQFNTSDTVYFPFKPIVECPQMQVDLETNRIRPCSTSVVTVRWQNLGTTHSDSVAVRLTLPASIELSSAQLPFIDQGNGQYLFNIGYAGIGSSGQFKLTVLGSCDLQIGETACLLAEITPDFICPTPAPIDSSLFQFSQWKCLEIRNSYDPNDKTAEPLGRGEQNYIPANTTLRYLIRFQNTGNDTAFTVVICDTLSPHLDLFTIQPEIASHPYRMEFQANGAVRFIFEQILLVDSLTNEPASHGFIRFSVKMKPNLVPSTSIANRAGIYFDFNKPILTNTVIHTIEENVISDQQELPQNPIVDFDIVPNPTQHTCRIFLAKEAGTASAVQIWNVFGKLETTIPLDIAQRYLDIDTYHWPKGIYWVVLQSNGQQGVKRLIKI